MWNSIWHNFFFDPVYNGLVFFVGLVPGGDVGVAIILTVIAVKIVVFPLSIRAVKTQYMMRRIEPELKELKEKYKDKREEQAKAMMELYRKYGVNPFASIVLMFIQIPVIIALYFAVARGGGVPLPDINVDILYTFIQNPETVTMIFLGITDISARSILLAALAGITQFIHIRLSLPPAPPKKEGEVPTFKDDFARSMQIQMRYVMPVIIFIFAYSISASIALYFTVSNLASIAQEFLVRKHKQEPADAEPAAPTAES